MDHRSGKTTAFRAGRDSGSDANVSGTSYSFLTRLSIAVLVVVVLAFAWLTREILLLIFGGILMGIFLCGVTKMVVRYTRLGRGWALALVLAMLTILTVLGGWFLGNDLVEQFGELRRGLTQSFTSLREQVLRSPLGGMFNNASETPAPSATQLRILAGYLTSGIGALAAPLIILVIGVYLAVDPGLYRRGVVWLVPSNHRPRAQEVLERSGEALWGWLWGRLFSMSLIGVTTLIGLWLLGIPIALSLALIAFVTNFIPYIGPLLSAVPAVLIALTLGPMQAVYVLLLYGGIQLVETNVITPLVELKSVNLPPVLTMSAQMISGLLFGPLGILFATPLTAVITVLVKTLYIEDVLEEPAP